MNKKEISMSENAESDYPCPCCGYLTFRSPPGSYDICPICYWEDDVFQLDNPLEEDGPNGVSLQVGQINFEKFGACIFGMVKYVRKPNSSDKKDHSWRKFDPAIDLKPLSKIDSRYESLTGRTLYYWQRKPVS
jgi:hypothetical protein